MYQPALAYHGGPVLHDVLSLYYIFYGDWNTADPVARAVLLTFAFDLAGSDYFAINGTYTDAQGSAAVFPILGGMVDDAGESQGASNPDIFSIVTNQIQTGALPADPNGVYFVFTSPDVAIDGEGKTFCGWHTYGDSNGTRIKYALVPSPNPGCWDYNRNVSPNADPVADNMINIIAHELSESDSDPELTGWYSGSWRENGDTCAWRFGATYQTANGSVANVNMNGSDYLVQQNFVNNGSKSYCALSVLPAAGP